MQLTTPTIEIRVMKLKVASRIGNPEASERNVSMVSTFAPSFTALSIHRRIFSCAIFFVVCRTSELPVNTWIRRRALVPNLPMPSSCVTTHSVEPAMSMARFAFPSVSSFLEPDKSAIAATIVKPNASTQDGMALRHHPVSKSMLNTVCTESAASTSWKGALRFLRLSALPSLHSPYPNIATTFANPTANATMPVAVPPASTKTPFPRRFSDAILKTVSPEKS